jgi:hypothetical protein
MKLYIKPKSYPFSHFIFKNFFVFAIISIICTGNAAALNPDVLVGDKDALVLNPAFKIKRMSTGIVIAYSNQTNGEAVRHEFENLYADVLLGAVRKQSISQLIPILARKYYYSTDECRREIKHVVHVLEEWDILVSNDVLP